MTTVYALCAASFQAGILLTLAGHGIHSIINKLIAARMSRAKQLICRDAVHLI